VRHVESMKTRRAVLKSMTIRSARLNKKKILGRNWEIDCGFWEWIRDLCVSDFFEVK
jgi:hypothetical protein